MSGAGRLRARRGAARAGATLAALLLFALACAAVGLCLGAADLAPAQVLDALLGRGDDLLAEEIVVRVRLPQVLLGLGVGAALSVAGLLFQGLLRNDLAEPYLLGVGPGALLGVTLAALWLAGAEPGRMPPAGVRAPAAFAGALAVAALIFAFARRATRTPAVTVLLAGIAVGAFVHAVATVLLHAGVRDWHIVLRWLLGDLGQATLSEAGLLALGLLLGGGVAFVRARDLDALALGEEAAAATGVDLRGTLLWVGGAACLLAALSVAQAGLVGFVGLVVPHLARGLVGPGHRRALLASLLLGAGLLVLADALARSVAPPQGLPLGAVTAALGAPVLAILLLTRAR